MEQLERTVELMAQATQDQDRFLQKVHFECLLNKLWVNKMTEYKFKV